MTLAIKLINKVMKNSIFKNQYFIMVIVAIIITLIIVVSRTNFKCLIFNENCEEIVIDDSKNPNYLKLRDDIMAMSKQKWDKSAYNRIKQNINDYAATTPDPLIEESEQNNLSGLLDSKYFALIGDSVIQFLRGGTYNQKSQLEELENEVKKFVATTKDKELLNGIKANIKTYNDALYWCGVIYSYTANKPYSKYTTDKYKSTVLEYTTKEYLRENKYISKKDGLIDMRIKRLDEHAYMDNKFSNSDFMAKEKINIKRDTCCYCDKDYGTIYYTKYGYYRNLCDSLRLEVIKEMN